MTLSSPSAFRDQPFSPPPPGVKSNLTNPDSRAYQVYIAAGLCLAIILVFVSLRFYAKVAIMKNMRWDDFISGGASGIHEWDMTIADLTKEQVQLSLVLSAIYGPCIWFVKLSVSVLYLEVFSLLRWFRYLVFAGIFITGNVYFITMAVFLARCAPKDGSSVLSYLRAQASPRCAQTIPIMTSLGFFNVISDLYLILIPLPVLWSLQLTLRKKIGLATMFLTGSIACVASIFALVYRFKQHEGHDATWDVIPSVITTIIEFTAGIVVCCMPPAMAAVRTLRTSVSSLLAAHFFRTRGGAASSSSTSIHDNNKKVGIFAHLHDKRREAHKNMHPPCLGLEDSPSVWQLEDVVTQPIASATNFPPEEHRILKTTNIVDVERSNSSSLGH